MQYRQLGRSGLTVSVVGLGTNNFGKRMDEAAAHAVVGAAIDAGITLIDTADSYGDVPGRSEEILGRALGSRRDQVVLATKFGHASADLGYGPAAGARGGRSYIRRAVEGSLRRLGTDHIDLYQFHLPDPLTPIEETLAALDELVQAGLVRYVGHSNFSAAQTAEAALLARELRCTPCISAQVHWSLLDREVEAEVVPTVERHGLGILPYFPLAQGLLTGKVSSDGKIPEGSRLAQRRELVTPERLAVVDRLDGWARDHGRSLLEVAFGGLLAHRVVGSVIAGATRPEQIEANAAAGVWEPTPAEAAEIHALLD